MLSVVCFQWNTGFREYLPRHVNALAAMYMASYPGDMRFICVTDETDGFSRNVEVLKTPAKAAEVGRIPSPHGKSYPASYRRLWLFSDEAAALGERILLTDIDCLVVGDISPLVDVDADFVGWQTKHRWGNTGRIAGGSWLLRTGTHAHVWNDFIEHPYSAIDAAAKAGWTGSDQAWLSYKLNGCTVWPDNSGIYQNQDGIHQWQKPKPDARIIHFNGSVKPWSKSAPKWAQDRFK